MPDTATISAGSPRIKPLRETRMPIVKQTPPRPLPPNMERRERHELREKFPRVRPESDSRGQQPRGGTPAVVPPTSPGPPPAARQGRERDGLRTPDRSKERTTPVTPQSSQPGTKSRDENRGSTGESRVPQGVKPAPQTESPQGGKPAPQTKPPQEGKPAPQVQPPQGGKPVPQAQPPQRGEDRRNTSPATVPEAQRVRPSGGGPTPERATRPGEERQRTVTPPSVGTQGQPVTVPPRSDERKNSPAPAPVPASPPRAEKPQGGSSAPATTSRPAAPGQRAEQPRREPSDKETKPRQIWRVTTPEATPAPSQTLPQDREGRGRERR